jgi:16S rRNA processing protein RimM
MRAHGVHGAVAVLVYNPDNPEGLLKAPQVFLLPKDPLNQLETPTPLKITGKIAPYGLILKITGVTTREAAMALKNQELAVLRDDLPPLEEGEYYQADLLGLKAYLTDGQCLGQVKDCLTPGETLILVIEDDNGLENLIPFTEDLVPIVDLTEQRLVINECPGLIQSPKSP